MSAAIVPCFGQGTVYLNNVSPDFAYVGSGTTTKASAANSANIRFALYWGATGSTYSQLVQISSTGVATGTTAGIVSISPVVAGLYGNSTTTYLTGAETAPGGSGVFQVRAWDSTFGSTWEAFVNNSLAVGANFGLTTVMNITTGNPAGTPPTQPTKTPGSTAGGTINLLTYDGSLATVPEPATYAMGMMGLGLAWLIRRRQA